MNMQKYEPSGEIVSATPLSPAMVAENAADQANVLMDIINRGDADWVMVMGKSRYLRFEAWQTIAQFNRCSSVTEWTHPVYDEDNRLVAYEARVKVIMIDTGMTVGAAESMCGINEHVTKGRSDTMGKHNAARSMAQTRAASKALRMIFSFVVVLAGYSPTSAEEMIGDRPRLVDMGKKKNGKLGSSMMIIDEEDDED